MVVLFVFITFLLVHNSFDCFRSCLCTILLIVLGQMNKMAIFPCKILLKVDLSKFIASLRGKLSFLFLYKCPSQVIDRGHHGPLVLKSLKSSEIKKNEQRKKWTQLTYN